MTDVETQLRTPLFHRDGRGWWTYHRWGLATMRSAPLVEQVRQASIIITLARNMRMGFERDGRYWVQ